MKIGIALSGGAARGWAHIGVIKALEENGIVPEVISGTSAGAIVAAIYANGKTPDEMEEITKDASIWKIYSFGLSNFTFMPASGLTKLNYLEKVLAENLPESGDFKDLQKQLFVATSNLNTCDCEIFNQGNIVQAVTASAAIPIIFKPQVIGKHKYVDGGMINNLPIEPLKSICDLVIGVNVNPHQYETSVSNIFEIGKRSFEMIIWNNTSARLSECDIQIEPTEVFEYGLFDFKKAEKIIQAAYESTKNQMPQIRQIIKEKQEKLSK